MVPVDRSYPDESTPVILLHTVPPHVCVPVHGVSDTPTYVPWLVPVNSSDDEIVLQTVPPVTIRYLQLLSILCTTTTLNTSYTAPRSTCHQLFATAPVDEH